MPERHEAASADAAEIWKHGRDIALTQKRPCCPTRQSCDWIAHSIGFVILQRVGELVNTGAAASCTTAQFKSEHAAGDGRAGRCKRLCNWFPFLPRRLAGIDIRLHDQVRQSVRDQWTRNHVTTEYRAADPNADAIYFPVQAIGAQHRLCQRVQSEGLCVGFLCQAEASAEKQADAVSRLSSLPPAP